MLDLILSMIVLAQPQQPAQPPESETFVRVGDSFVRVVKEDLLAGLLPMPKNWYVRNGSLYTTGREGSSDGKEVEIEVDGFYMIYGLDHTKAIRAEFVQGNRGSFFIVPLSTWRQYADRLKEKK